MNASRGSVSLTTIFIDYDREMALVADYHDPATGEHQILGIVRLSKLHRVGEAEFALLVSDAVQGLGLGTELLRRLLTVGRDEHITGISADILNENTAMQHICEKVGFQLHRNVSPVQAEITLSESESPAW
jgi:acetyltransferase